MAQHKVKMYAVDSYVEDRKNFNSVSRGSTLTGQEVGTLTYWWSNTYGGQISEKYTTDKQIYFKFSSPTHPNYKKKHLVSATEAVYITAKSASQSGGVFEDGPGFSVSLTYGGFSEGAPTDNIHNLPLNEYFIESIYLDPYRGNASDIGYVNVYMSGLLAYSSSKRNSNFNLSVTIQSHSAQNPPYRELLYEDVPITAKGTSPINIYINPYKEVNYGFSIEMTQTENTEEPLYIQKAKFQFRFGGSSEIQEVERDIGKDMNMENGRNSKRAISTFNTTAFPKKSYFEWRVLIMSDDGIWSEPSPWYYVNTTDATSYSYPTEPVNAYVDGSKDVWLRWSRSISTGTLSNGADFQVSSDGGVTWQDLGSSEGYADFKATPGTLPAGNVLWRVRSYNSDDVAGPWSAAANIIVRQAPAVPGIASVTTTPKPTVSWNATGQQAYQLQIGTWDSGTVFGTAKTDQCPEFLPDGPTAVRLRVQNTFGMWSQWAETNVTIANISGEAIAARAMARRADIRITWETKGEYPEYLIYRDGEVIGVTAGKQYIDHTAIGKAAYTVRGVNYNGTYTDSPPATEIIRLDSGVIAVLGEWEWLPLKCRRGRYPGVETSRDAEITYTQYSGRDLPVAEISGHYTRQHTLDFTIRSRKEKESLEKMVGKMVVYKDMWERIIIGIMGNLYSISDWATDVSFTVTEVDHGPVL